MKGRKPIPAGVKLATGRRVRRKNVSGVEAPPGRPACPPHIKGEALKMWNHLLPRLEAMNVISDIDGGALECYCLAHETVVNCTKKIKKQGMTIKTPYGPKLNPLMNAREKASAQMKGWADLLGLTASSRCRLNVSKGDKVNKPSLVDAKPQPTLRIANE